MRPQTEGVYGAFLPPLLKEDTTVTRRLLRQELVIALILSAVMAGVCLSVISSGASQAACVTAAPGGSAQNTAFASQAGTFTAEFDSTPSVAGMNGVVGLSRGAQTGFAGFACLVSFSNTGQIVARNGGSYAAATPINYFGGVTYHFRLVVNVTAHTYSIFATPQGGAEQTVGSNFAFRTEQNTIPSLDNWGTFVTSTTGSLTTCNFSIGGMPSGCGRTISVNSNSGLSSAVSNALPGDCIVLANGAYSGFTISRDGASNAPIVIRAANLGGATISSGIIRFNGTSFVTVEGLNITTAGSAQTVDGESFPVGVWFDSADNCRITRSTFRLSGHANGAQFIMLGGNSNRNRIDHCEFGPNTVDGAHYIFVRGQRTIAGVTPDPLQDRGPWSDGDGPVNPNMARNTQIDHNYFHDMASGTAEAIVLGGLGITGDYQNLGTIVESNLFVRCDGDPECISIKSSGNTIRYNTILTSVGGIVSRSGNQNQIIGNFIRGGGTGIRIHEKDHTVYNNYVENTSDYPFNIGNGNIYNQTGFTHAQVVRARVAHNTFVQINSRPVIIGWSSRPLLPQDCVFANNILSGSAPLLSATNDGNTLYSNNIANGNLGSSLPSSQFMLVDPLLATSGGILKLTSGSPAINAANGSFYSFVTDDMDGQARSGSRDIGADEFSSATILRRPLTTADVGPNAP